MILIFFNKLHILIEIKNGKIPFNIFLFIFLGKLTDKTQVFVFSFICAYGYITKKCVLIIIN